MNLALIGARGIVGSRILTELLNRNHTVTENELKADSARWRKTVERSAGTRPMTQRSCALNIYEEVNCDVPL